MSDIVKTAGQEANEPSKIEEILERAATDDTFRDQLFNEFDAVASEYNLTQEDMEALGEAYNTYVESGMIEVLDSRDNPVVDAIEISCCCCSPCCCCCA